MRIWLYGHILWLILRRALIIHSYFFIYLSRPKCRVCQEYVCPWDTYEFCQLLVGGTVISFLKWCNFHMYFSDIEMCIASQRCMLLRTSKVCYFRTTLPEEPGGLQSRWSQRVGLDWATGHSNNSLEPASLWSRVVPSEAVRVNVFQASPSLLGVAGKFWHPLISASPQSLPSSSDHCLVCVCPNSPFDKDSSHVGLGTTLMLSSLLDYLHL